MSRKSSKNLKGKGKGQVIVETRSVEDHKVKPSEDSETFGLLDQIKKILRKSSKFEPNHYYLSTGVNLFSKIFDLGLKSGDLILEITDLLVTNHVWIKNFLICFPRIFLTDIYSPEVVCKVRSGIEFLFNRLGNFTIDGNTLSNLLDPLGRVIWSLDSSLKSWLEDLENLVKDRPDHIPESHWWWWYTPPGELATAGPLVDKSSFESTVPNYKENIKSICIYCNITRKT